jgi:hypothetical protein
MTLFVVPIRFWEDDAEIQTVEDTEVNDRHVYGFCPQFGHKAYFLQQDCYETREACQREIQRRREIKKAEDDADVERVLKSIYQMYGVVR